MLNYVKRTGDSTAGFFMPAGMERVATAKAEHSVRSQIAYITAQLAQQFSEGS